MPSQMADPPWRSTASMNTMSMLNKTYNLFVLFNFLLLKFSGKKGADPSREAKRNHNITSSLCRVLGCRHLARLYHSAPPCSATLLIPATRRGSMGWCPAPRRSSRGGMS
uniref:Uncharacterized protein n=1 Tax=Sicyonia whispovirus TaxID=2984283 RepID=A0A9C7C6Z8_9VIRU|nr:MAG: hypothetical protein [Sicyonia whispovirus]